jgi:hypothetical protein
VGQIPKKTVGKFNRLMYINIEKKENTFVGRGKHFASGI